MTAHHPAAWILLPVGVAAACMLARSWLCRRADREYARDVARRVRDREAREASEVHDRAYLEWLDEQFDSKGRAR